MIQGPLRSPFLISYLSFHRLFLSFSFVFISLDLLVLVMFPVWVSGVSLLRKGLLQSITMVYCTRPLCKSCVGQGVIEVMSYTSVFLGSPLDLSHRVSLSLILQYIEYYMWFPLFSVPGTVSRLPIKNPLHMWNRVEGFLRLICGSKSHNFRTRTMIYFWQPLDRGIYMG